MEFSVTAAEKAPALPSRLLRSDGPTFSTVWIPPWSNGSSIRCTLCSVLLPMTSSVMVNHSLCPILWFSQCSHWVQLVPLLVSLIYLWTLEGPTLLQHFVASIKYQWQWLSSPGF